jgi:heptosyltransferase III
MNKLCISSILVIVQRSNGDVFLSAPLIEALFRAYDRPAIDLLVNDDTLAIARTLPHIRQIHTFSYGSGLMSKGATVVGLLRKITRRYDLSISLTSSDRSVIFALLSWRTSISAVDKERRKAWWKCRLLSYWYEFDASRHIVQNNTAALRLLGLPHERLTVEARHTPEAARKIDALLRELGVERFFIFHPGAQYDYKIYPEALRNELLRQLDRLGLPVLVTGSNSEIDLRIKRSLPKLGNLHDLIGRTTLDELIALSARSLAYIGADTLNMHIAAAQNRRVFAIFGPTILSMWSPWCNALHAGTSRNAPVQTYGNITIFQAAMPCIGCGKAGCDDHHGKSDCLYAIEPETISNEVSAWLTTLP